MENDRLNGEVMSKAEPRPEISPTVQEVADYLRDMAGQLAEMAQRAGLKETALAFVRARDLCDAAEERKVS